MTPIYWSSGCCSEERSSPEPSRIRSIFCFSASFSATAVFLFQPRPNRPILAWSRFERGFQRCRSATRIILLCTQVGTSSRIHPAPHLLPAWTSLPSARRGCLIALAPLTLLAIAFFVYRNTRLRGA